MIIFNCPGRLGNQLFQYAALRTLCQENERLVLFGFENLQLIFDKLDAKIINSRRPRLERYLSYRLYNFADYLSKKNIIQRAKQSKSSIDFISSSTFLKDITLFEKSYFQSESFFSPKIVDSLVLKPGLLAFAQQLLSTISLEKTPIFVHIRRGDYLLWPNKESPAVLPDTYYHKCIELIRVDIPDAFFIFTSDEPDYVKNVYGNLANSYISEGTVMEDFALMTQCKGGILSASSFAWWAAYFSKLWQNSSTFLAPKYWAGHSRQQWYPAFIEATFLTYIEV